MASLTFSHLAVPLPIAVGESLFDAARQAGLPIPTACVGQGTCGLCRVKVIAGERHLSPRAPSSAATSAIPISSPSFASPARRS